MSLMCFDYATLPRSHCSTYSQPGDDKAKWENSIIGAHKNNPGNSFDCVKNIDHFRPSLTLSLKDGEL